MIHVNIRKGDDQPPSSLQAARRSTSDDGGKAAGAVAHSHHSGHAEAASFHYSAFSWNRVRSNVSCYGGCGPSEGGQG